MNHARGVMGHLRSVTTLGDAESVRGRGRHVLLNTMDVLGLGQNGGSSPDPMGPS